MIKTWRELPFFRSQAWEDVQTNLSGKIYLPDPNLVFRALALTPPDKVKVVILGQDPYPTPGHADGLAFSVSEDTKPLPPSLKNIFKELVADTKCEYPPDGRLDKWAEEGVLLLNTALTVLPGKAGSMSKIGWHCLISDIIVHLINNNPNVVYVLWGNKAKEYAEFMPRGYKKMVRSSHPSPLGARHGFTGSKPFSKVNRILRKAEIEPINWSLS
jgi:uracil-DNA glycosylase